MRLMVWALISILAGCTTTTVPPASEASVESIPGRLSPVALASGECGLFVWAADDEKTFILFSQSAKKTGLWFDGKSEQELSIKSEDGIKASGQFPILEFEGQNGLNLILRLGDAQSIADGTRFKTGLLKHQSVEGWEKITPVVGLAACQSE